RVAARVPPELGGVVDRALAFEKADRWPSAEAMDAALLRACEGDLGASAWRPLRIDVPAKPLGPVDEPPPSSPMFGAPSPFDVGPSERTEAIRDVETHTMPGSSPPRRRWSRRARVVAAVAIAALIGGLAALASSARSPLPPRGAGGHPSAP